MSNPGAFLRGGAAVGYTPQVRTDSQRAQARDNVGAAKEPGRNPDDLIRITRPIQKIAMAGDSHLNDYTYVGLNPSRAGVHSAFSLYDFPNLTLVPPSGRSRVNHAIGGSTVTLFLDGHTSSATGGSEVVQSDELLTAIGAGEIDTVVLSLGTNDLIADPDPTDALDRLDDEFVTPFVAAGGSVILLDIPPCKDLDFLGNEYRNRVSNSVRWNAAMRAKFGGRDHVGFHSMAWKFAETGNTAAYAWLLDGTHLNVPATLNQGIDLLEALTPFSPGVVAATFDTEWTSPNPFEIEGVTGLMTGSTGLSVYYIDRTDDDAEEGERDAVVSFTRTYDLIGTADANSAVRFTFHSTENNQSPLAAFEIFVDTYLAGIFVNVRRQGSYAVISVRVPGSSSSAPTVTANQVITAVNASAASQFGVASVDGTGDGTATTAYGVSKKYLLSNANLSDAVTISNGDILRGYAEILPVEGSPLYLSFIYSSLYAYAGSAGHKVTGLDQTWNVFPPYPLADDGIMRVTTPWYTVASGATNFVHWLYFAGCGKFRVRRCGVQRKVIP